MKLVLAEVAKTRCKIKMEGFFSSQEEDGFISLKLDGRHVYI